MSKIKLKKLDNYEFEYNRILNVGDINYGGHLGNDSVITLIHEARIDLLCKLGLSELDLGNGRTGIIMTDLIVNYTGEGFLLDKIKILSHIDDIKSIGFRVFHNIIKNDKTIALAETGIYAFDYENRNITEIPELFNEKLNDYLKKHEN